VRVGDGRVEPARAPVEGADAIVVGAVEAVAAAIYGGAPPDALEITGDRTAAMRFMGFFRLPPKAGAG